MPGILPMPGILLVPQVPKSLKAEMARLGHAAEVTHGLSSTMRDKEHCFGQNV